MQLDADDSHLYGLVDLLTKIGPVTWCIGIVIVFVLRFILGKKYYFMSTLNQTLKKKK